MMRAVVTGAAGFIGSHLAEGLRSAGHEVVGVDAFTDYYEVGQKRANATDLTRHGLDVIDADLLTADLAPLVAGADVVFHQAGQPGVRASWDTFALYTDRNVTATQRLLDAIERTGGGRLVFASSSSIYGDAAEFPTPEDAVPTPVSPYGITKLAAEHLCRAYAGKVTTVALRQFTVYGSRQRPDMALHQLIEAALTGDEFEMFGGGDQERDFTHVSDVVAANIAAARADLPPWSVFNVSGGGSTTLNALVELVEQATGRPVPVRRVERRRGDARRTGGSVERARGALGWQPQTALPDGVAEQVAWHVRRRGEAAS